MSQSGDAPTPESTDPLFAGRAGVARDMAAVDWAATPLGPPAGWPTPLRDVVRILLTSRFAMWMAWGPELTMFYNDAYQRATLRRKHPWALGRPFDEVWAEIREALSPQIRTVLEDGESTWDEDLLLFLERYGWPEETYHTFSYSPLYEEDGGPVRGLLCVVAETTERVLAERRMAFLRELASSMTSARSIDEVTAAAREVFGQGHRDLPFGLLYLLDPAAGPGTARLTAAVGVDAEGPAAPPTVEVGVSGRTWPSTGVAASPRLLPLGVDALPGVPEGCDRVAVVPLTPATTSGQEGGPIGVLVVGLSRYLADDDRYRDFVALVAGQVTSGVLDARAAEADRQRAEALADLDRARRRFFADASHELRTPLTLVAGPVDDLLAEAADGVVDPLRWRGELEVVARNTRRLRRVVDDLLEVARLQAGEVDRHREVVDVGQLTAELAAMVASAMERAGLEYVVDVVPGTVPVEVDRDGWERIVLNLVTNALKYTRAGRVEVTLRREGQRAVLTVSDTGVGIPAGDLPRLFDRFHRVEGSWARSAEGSGIGLALVHEITTRHGGDVEVTSAAGVGTTFTVVLPVAATGPAAPAPAVGIGGRARALMDEASRWIPGDGPEDDVVSHAGAGHDGDKVGRVLVADDNADMRAYVTRLLAPRCAVTAVADGEAALASALADPPDMVVADVVMPGRSGLDLLAALRADPRTARTPVLLLSARAGEDAAVEGLAAQADDYLAKPFSAAELQARVSAHLQLGRARREAEARFSAVADLAPVMIWVAGGDGARLFLNAGWSRFTGLDPTTELGHGWFDGVHPDDRAAYGVAADRGRAEVGGWEVDYRLRHADGTYHRVVEQAVPVPGAGGPDGAAAATGWIGSCVDVHARLRDADRAKLLAEIGEAMETSETVAERLGELVRVLRDARLGDRVRVVDPSPGARPEDGTHRLRRPLVVRGRLVGVLEIERDAASEPWSADDRTLTDEVVVRILPTLENALLRTEERIAADRLVLVHRATAAFSAAATPSDVARIAATHVETLLEPDLCAVYEFDESTRRLTVLARRPAERDPSSSADVVPVGVDSILTRAVHDEQAVWVHEPEAGEGPGEQDPTLVAMLRGRSLTKAVSLPLIAAGRVVGALEVGFAGRGRLDEGERTTLQALAEPCGVALDRARLYRAEHQIAQTLQQSLLPQGLPVVPRLPVAVRYQPGAVGTSAGGDWYDVVEVDDTHVAVVVGDVVGQGTAAAAVMGQLRTALSGYLLAGHGPGPALDLLDGLVARVPGARASTAVCVLVDIVTGESRWARAGHLPVLLAPADGGRPHLLTDTAGHGPLLGLAHARPGPRTEGTTTIAPGTSLVLYTDGLVERRGESLDEGLDRLVEVAAACEDRAPETMASALLSELVPARAIDDVAVVVVRLGPAPLEVDLRADPARLGPLRRAVAAWAAQAGLADVVLEDLQVALGEAATNAVEHAYGAVPPAGADVAVRLTLRADGGVAVRVRDRGTWRPAPADPGHRGRGLLLIRALATDVVVEGGSDGTAVTFTVVPGRHEAGDAHPEAPPESAPRPVLVEYEAVGGGHIVRVSGDLDLAGAQEARRRISAAEHDGPWTLDVTGVGYLASAGVGLLLEAAEHGAELVVPERGPVARVLSLSGLSVPPRMAGRS